MKIFTCKKRFEDMMTCIYDAWEYALKYGHGSVKLMCEPVIQYTFAEEYVHIEADKEKSDKVVRSIIKDISYHAYMYVYYSTLYCEDVLDDIYRFLNLGFREGAEVINMMTDACVVRMMSYKRKVCNEIHYFREFLRFNSIDNKVYVAHVEPKCDIIYLTALHFADRMISEHFLIIDDNRRYAVVHPADQDMYITDINDREFEELAQTETYSDEYRNLWNLFFDTIGIKERENKSCQRNMFPVWMRKHAVEFVDENS